MELSHAFRAFSVVTAPTQSHGKNQSPIMTIKLLPEFQSDVHVYPFIASPTVFTNASDVLDANNETFKTITVKINLELIQTGLNGLFLMLNAVFLFMKIDTPIFYEIRRVDSQDESGRGALSHGDLSDARLSPKTSVWDDTVIFDSSFFIFKKIK